MKNKLVLKQGKSEEGIRKKATMKNSENEKTRVV